MKDRGMSDMRKVAVRGDVHKERIRGCGERYKRKAEVCPLADGQLVVGESNKPWRSVSVAAESSQRAHSSTGGDSWGTFSTDAAEHR